MRVSVFAALIFIPAKHHVASEITFQQVEQHPVVCKFQLTSTLAMHANSVHKGYEQEKDQQPHWMVSTCHHLPEHKH